VAFGDVSRVGAVVFDLDGTLIDSSADIASATNFTLEQHGLPRRTLDEIRGFIGDGARSLLARAAALPEQAPELEPLLATFLAHYSRNPIIETHLFEGVRELLARLSALPLCLCTNKPRLPTLAVLEGLGVHDAFRVILCGDDLPQKKPDPALLRHIAVRLELEVSALVMVGDGPQDIACARAAGARSVGVIGNIVAPERLRAAGPDVVVPLSEVADVIERWRRAGRSA
jgi:2-phosphoglycolate phosphatase